MVSIIEIKEKDKVKMKKIILTLLIGLFATSLLLAQIEATTKDGRKAILYDDGTWKYAETSKAEISQVSFECADLVVTETDKMTGRISTSSKEVLAISDDGGKTGFGIFCMKGSNSIIMIIQVVGAGSCINDDNKVNILFRDGSKLELSNDGKFNCDAKFTIYFGGIFQKKKELNELKTKEIETMRVWTTKSYVQKDFSNEQSKILMTTLKCLSEK